jgi:sugar (pentulose or hexulose) kinase
MTLVVGIDIGTSGVRAVAVDPEGRQVGEAKIAMPPPDREGVRICQSPSIWSDAAWQALDALFHNVDPKAVGALAIDGTSGTVMTIDAAGHPVGPGLLYNDAAETAAAAAIGKVAPRNSAAHGDTSGLAKAMALIQRPGAARVLHQADYIAFQLAGIVATDENNALKTGYDPIARTWPDWIATLGFDRDFLPIAFEPGSRLGPVTAAAARRFGLRPDTIVAAGTTDGCASFLATGANQPGDAVTALGTTLTLKLLSAQPIFSPQHGVYSHRLGDRWLAGGASNSGGAVLLQFFDAAKLEHLTARLVPETPTGLNYYPLNKPGERFPIADPALPPRMSPRPEDDAMFLQGLLEGIASIEATGYRLLSELGGPEVKQVLSVGGGARNEAWTRIRANRLGVPVLTATTDEAAYGAARLARMAISAA